MGAFHFQQLFVEWAGVSPKQFVSYRFALWAQ
jgi:hypothetical protein